MMTSILRGSFQYRSIEWDHFSHLQESRRYILKTLVFLLRTFDQKICKFSKYSELTRICLGSVQLV